MLPTDPLILAHACCVVFVLMTSLVSSEDVIVDSPAGKVSGFREEVKHTGKKADIFYGIPFAVPPIGNLRFTRPKPLPKWTGVVDAKKLPNSCWQTIDTAYKRFPGVEMWNPNTPLHEDCLYLNIWTPEGASTSSSKKYSVMVWIFGGGFYSGTSTLKVYDAKYLAVEQDVVVVSMQYRIGLFGFMYLGDASPGNFGLLDQNLALVWIKQNIAAYGGDANSVTLFGESAGAASVSFHLLSPLSKPLFHRAIMQSSSSISPWALKSPEFNLNKARRVAKLVDCDRGTDNAKTVECLRTINSEKLANVQWEVQGGFFDFPVTVIVDGYFLLEHPLAILTKKLFKPCPILAGTVKDEGVYFMMYGMEHLFPYNGVFKGDRKAYEEAVKLNMASNYSLVYDAIDFEYVRSQREQDRGSYRDVIDDVVGDYNFLCPVQKFAEYYAAEGQDTYVYRFLHRSTKNPWPEWMGVMHGYEIEFIFGLPLNNDLGYKADDIEVARRTMRYWSNFAKTGDPNKASSSDQSTVEWPKFTSQDKKFVEIKPGTGTPSTGVGPRLGQCALWNYYIPRLTSSLQSYDPDCLKSSTSSGTTVAISWSTATLSFITFFHWRST